MSSPGRGNSETARDLLSRPWLAYTVCLSLYAIGWIKGLLLAIFYVSGGDIVSKASPGAATISHFSDVVADAGLVIIGLIFAFIVAPSSVIDAIKLPRGKVRVGIDARIIGSIFLAIILSSALAATLFEPTAHPNIGSESSLLADIAALVSMIMAGPSEEIILVLVPVLLLRNARRSWVEIVTFCVVIRVAFHVFYGWGSVFLAIWAATAVIMFWYSSRILPMIIAHSLFNGMNGFANKFAVEDSIESVASVMYLVVGVVLCTIITVTSIKKSDWVRLESNQPEKDPGEIA